MKKFKTFEFVITGGPCSGKTTGISVLEQKLSDNGFKVIVVQETATEIISSGITPWEINSYNFQQIILERSLNKEETTRKAVLSLNKDTVIIYDRGLLDSKAYIYEKQWQELLLSLGLNEIDLRDQYEGVFHLVTAANGAEEFYTLANNKARTETPEKAREVDIRTQNAWVGHPHLRIIDNSTCFEEKIDRLYSEILATMGLPIPIEIERKFLVEVPTIEVLKHFNAVESKIVQTYLSSINPNIERRVRQRGNGENFSYYYTEKETISEMKRFETERKISEREYLKYLLEANKMLRKNRFCFIFKSQYLELDIYPQKNGLAVLEIELTKENQEIIIPDFIKIIKEVTNDPSFKNYNLAQ